ncbi:MAG: Tm-1-like ATP-binding domain-containing protein [Aestuariivirga sp.]|nr:Tm-1-like ATP-binding domain-containing protein [Aestuariivirga sp.]
MGKVYIIGTLDTKEAELRYAKRRAEKAGAKVVLVDVSTTLSKAKADVSAREVARHYPKGEAAVLGLADRGAAVGAMAEALSRFMVSRRDVGAVLGLGGSGNTVIVTTAMRALPVGVPKLMVSTVASGNVAPYVGPSDIAMMYAVVDVAGLNAISRKVIANAAHAAAGMALNPVKREKADKPGVGLTMFGVTTPCITQIRARIEKEFECFVFHATGTGGQSMEKLVDSGLLESIIDITTTEVADYLFGGILPCTEDRFGSIIRTKIPYVGSVGAVDMVNFGARETVPKTFEGRKFYIHNPQVTLMRTTPAENRAIGRWIVDRLNRMTGPVRFLLPLKGVSAIDAAGQPFHDPEADAALFAAIREGWVPARNRKLVEVDAHINDPAFAAEAVKQFKAIV